jgi:hypothetical protein
MAYVVKWTDPEGRTHASEAQESPADALRFSHSPRLARALRIWAESDKGHKFPLRAPAAPGPDERTAR